jgi:O-antigen ligase
MSRARGLWLALGAVGAIVLVVFDTPVTLTVGVLALIAFVACGVALIASPEFLSGEDDDG